LNQEAYFPTNLILKDKIIKKISILKTCKNKKKIVVKRINIKFDIKTPMDDEIVKQI